jgi:hypothetical protein
MSRKHVAHETSRKLAAAPRLSGTRATIGIDGFVDSIISVVDKRLDRDRFEPIPSIEKFGQKVLSAAGQSCNFELVVKQTKLGGNGPILANALASAGLTVEYIGAVGYPKLHPVFEELARRAAKVTSIAEPGLTDALEFADGKLMLGKYRALGEVTWEHLVARVGIENLTRSLAESSLIGIVNWTMIPQLTDIWHRLSSEVLPRLPGARRYFFVDLCDPAKRLDEDLGEALNALTEMQQRIDVMLGCNLKEASQVARVMGLPKLTDDEESIQQSAASIRQKLQLDCVMIHPRRGAAAATRDASAWFSGPFVKEPRISTGAGDHFNAGFCLGRVLGMSLEESLCTGVATSGYYVRSAQSPSTVQLADFIETLPPPET